MKVILFGATGMVGQGVLRECLVDAGVESVLCVGRSPTGQQHAKLHAGIQPLHGVRSKTAWVQAIYVIAAPLCLQPHPIK
jgi:uncharacterized protein YbjT (DUF2867 family)